MLRKTTAFLILLAVLALGLALLPGPIQAQAADKVVIYFFWGDGCPHCAAAEPVLARLAEEHPEVELREFEVWHHEENQAPMTAMAAKFGFQPSGVPTIFIGDRYWVGYAEEPIGREIKETVAACLVNGCPDAGQGVFTSAPAPTAGAPTAGAPTTGVPTAGAPAALDVAVPTETPAAAAAPVEVCEACPATAPDAGGVPDDPTTGGAATPPVLDAAEGADRASRLNLPLIGAVDLAAQSLVLSTALIAFVDGFNPCSLWVLSMLIALTLHMGSRKKLFIVGLVFIAVTGLVYALFIAGLFTMFSVLNVAGWVRVVVALVALFFALVNIKDYFWYKEGLSFTIADDKKPGLYKRMRRIAAVSDSWPALIGATVVLAAGVSLVEFSCTAGFPMLWTNLLIAQGATPLMFIALLALYLLIYQLDEFVIFGAAVVSLRASRLQEKQGRILKLISGTLMLTLAGVMLIDPNLMNEVTSSLIVFGIAFGIALLVLLLHRVVLPRLGVRIGTEFADSR